MNKPFILLSPGKSERREIKVESFNHLQKIVEGYIETIILPHGYRLVVNEEGGLKNLPFNLQASITCGQAILGKAVHCHVEALTSLEYEEKGK